MNANTTGTVKVGRWEYPAEVTDTGIRRNAKRDGSGEWIEGIADAKVIASFVADATATDEVAETIGTLTAVQREVMAAVGSRQFDYFDDGIAADSGIWFGHMCQQTPNSRKVRDAVTSLARGGKGRPQLWIVGEADGTGTGIDRWVVLTGMGAAVANRLASTFDGWSAIQLPSPSHGRGGGNQTKRPGKSSWRIGDPCPQGHILTESTLYTMPSGRNQCRECRAGMPSRQN